MERERILVVDDEQGMRLGLSEVLERGGYRVHAVEDGRAALATLSEQPYGLVISDMRMPSMGGAELLGAVQERHAGTPMVMMTAYGTVEDAVTCMKSGASDFLTKPFAPQDLLHLVRRVLSDADTPATRRPARVARKIVTRSPALARVLTIAEGVAGSRAPVLIEGESGTGKELLARHVHEAGPRQGKPFVAVNCAALPRELLESELFGHERGAFTGATGRKLGKFELASGGTLLLDEISEMEAPLQAKLLRVLQEHEVDRVGGTRPVAIDTRVVATTNRPLRSLVAGGSFRRDLYYRLHVVPLVIPPLRERPEDIEPLIDHFRVRFGAGGALEVTPEARAYLARQSWPGNVRELEHTIERGALLCAGKTVALADVKLEEEPFAQESADAGLAGRTVHDVERQLIFETLRRTDNNRSRAAEMLGISVRTLRNKLAEYRAQGHAEAGYARA